MTTPTPEIHTIFDGAIACETDEARRQYLEEACAGDTKIRQRVEALLQAHSEAGGFFGGRATAPSSTDIRSLTENSGDIIGPYKLLQQIGEGGMGVVYMAEQTVPVDRRVALKIIKPGMDTQLVIARFEAERQALAMMDHPNIARVLDAGTTATGQPYFVMELVKGLPITQYCDEQHLSPRERLELFVPICQAVQHAHQKGIIHRDLKPSNILIARYDDKPVPKVIDFGVAKATSQKLTERTMFTQFGQLVGTIDYMSPEQAQFNQLDVDTRSDIYSLGVLLYELLTGETPFDRTRLRTAALEELLRIIREEEPPRPSVKLSTCQTLASVAANRHMEPHKLGLLVRGELDWIVMKALEKDRNRRYETANGFASDVLRYLADEPVAACPPSASYRFHKFARRNRAVLAMVAVVVVALLLGVIGTTWQAIRATQQRDRAVAAEQDAEDQRNLAQQRADEAEEARANAEANFQQARQAVDDMYTQVAEKWLAYQPNLEPLQREFLEKALHFYVNSAEQRSTDPVVRLETARAYRRVADIEHRLGRRHESEQAFDRAIDQLQSLADEFPACPEYRKELADTLHKLAVNIGDTRSHVEEAELHRRALVLEQQLAAEFPNVPVYRQDLGRGYCVLGRVLHSEIGQNALADAEQAVLSALAIQQSLVTDFPTVADYRRQLADSHTVLSENRKKMSHLEEARQERLKAAALLVAPLS